jgi:hypothetical protein
LSRIIWLGTTNTTADEEMREQAKKERSPSKVQEAAEWVKAFLAEFAYPSDEIMAAGMAAGHSFDNLKRAKASLKPEGLWSTKKGFQGEWWCGFNNPEIWQLRPEERRVQTKKSSCTLAPFAPNAPFARNDESKGCKESKESKGAGERNHCTLFDEEVIAEDDGPTPWD